MFQVSKLADYATVVMAYLARNINSLRTARDIAKATRIALPTVSKILKTMARAGLLDSTRGVKGGYSLARPAGEISIAEVLQAIDGDFGMTVCSHANGDCQLEPYCSIRCNWQLISQTMFNALQSLTLADMAKPMARRQLPVNQDIFIDALKDRDQP